MDLQEKIKILAKELEELRERIINSNLPYHLKEPYIKNEFYYRKIKSLSEKIK